MSSALFRTAERYRTLVVASLLASAWLTATPAAMAVRERPPAGLTAYGRVVWNLDALLHDRFGNRAVWANPSGPDGQITNFSTTFYSLASSTPYVYTFATAHRSSFRAMHPARPPKIGTYATGSNVPVTILGMYIFCGDGKWLYERHGQAFPIGPMWCSRTPLAP
jgi:hypothetical protein